MHTHTERTLISHTNTHTHTYTHTTDTQAYVQKAVEIARQQENERKNHVYRNCLGLRIKQTGSVLYVMLYYVQQCIWVLLYTLITERHFSSLLNYMSLCLVGQNNLLKLTLQVTLAAKHTHTQICRHTFLIVVFYPSLLYSMSLFLMVENIIFKEIISPDRYNTRVMNFYDGKEKHTLNLPRSLWLSNVHTRWQEAEERNNSVHCEQLFNADIHYCGLD